MSVSSKDSKTKVPPTTSLKVGLLEDSQSVVSQVTAASSSTRKGPKRSFVGSTDSSVPGLVNTSRNALMDSIRDMERSERNRQKWMDQARDQKRRNQLEARYEKERAEDNQKLERLMKDFQATKEHAEKGSFNTISQMRSSHRPREWNNLTTMNTNRFHGLESTGEHAFHRKRIETFDKTDRRVMRMLNAQSFDIYEEKRKANLLREKRDVLEQMVGLTKQEFFARRNGGGGGGAGSGSHRASLSSLAYHPTPRGGGGSDSISVASGESWATFGSARSASATVRRGTARPSNVPKLKL